jgi:hypothetical protein
MPTRTLRAKPSAAQPMKDYKHAIAYHSSAITIFWILFLFLSLGFAFLSLAQYAKIEMLMQDVALLDSQLSKTQTALLNLQQKSQAVPAMIPAPSEPSSPAVLEENSGPVYAGILTRGAVSPDGTKYAGYDDVTAGKLGIGVETLADGRVRRVVLFSRSESSGTTSPEATSFTVRWKDNSTIEYDVEVTGAGRSTKETRTVKIGF